MQCAVHALLSVVVLVTWSYSMITIMFSKTRLTQNGPYLLHYHGLRHAAEIIVVQLVIQTIKFLRKYTNYALVNIVEIHFAHKYHQYIMYGI